MEDNAQRRPEASLAIQMLPKTTENTDEKTVEIVDAILAYIKESNLIYHVGPFETTIEGSLEQLIELQKGCFERCIQLGAYSVAGYMKLYYSPSKGVMSISKKIDKHH